MQKETIYINFLENESYYLIKLLTLDSKEIKTPKTTNKLKDLLKYYNSLGVETKFYFSINNNDFRVVLNNNNLIVFYNEKNGLFIIYDLNNNNYFTFDLTNNFINDKEDFIFYFVSTLKENNCSYNVEDLKTIIENSFN